VEVCRQAGLAAMGRPIKKGKERIFHWRDALRFPALRCYWKNSVGRASVPAKTMGGQGRPLHRKMAAQELFQTVAHEPAVVSKPQKARWHSNLWCVRRTLHKLKLFGAGGAGAQGAP